jgi:hypothetical protein
MYRSSSHVVRAMLAILMLIGLTAFPGTVQAADPYIMFIELVSLECDQNGYTLSVSWFWNIPDNTTEVVETLLNGEFFGVQTLNYSARTNVEESGTYTLGLGATITFPYTSIITDDIIVDGKLTSRSIITLTCTDVNQGTVTISNFPNVDEGGFDGPPLPGPDRRNLVLIAVDTAVLDSPDGAPINASLKPCQTVFIIGTSDDGKFGQVHRMGGWIPLANTIDIAEDYGQPGGQAVLPQCADK